MKTYFLNYFCFVDVQLGENNTTDLYYYSGKLIKKAYKNIAFDDLPVATQNQILTKLVEVNKINFKKRKSGFDGEKYFMILSEKAIEVFEVKHGAFDGFILKDYKPDSGEMVFDWQIAEMRNTAICILQDQYFRESD